MDFVGFQKCSNSATLFTTEDVLSGVYKLEKAIESPILLSFQIQISAAIGFSLEFFTRYEAFMMTQRRRRAGSVLASTSSDAADEALISTSSPSPTSPQCAIARVCQSLKLMDDIIFRNGPDFLLFSDIISDIIASLSLVTAATVAATHANGTTSPSMLHHLTSLPTKNDTFVPPTDILERLMNTFGHFKNNFEGISRNLDHNIVILTGDPGMGKSCLACAFAHRSIQLKKYEVIRWISSDAASAHAEWLSFALSLHLRMDPDMPLEALIEHVYRRLRKCSYLLILDDMDSMDLFSHHSRAFDPRRGDLFPVAYQHILITSRLQLKWSSLCEYTAGDESNTFVSSLSAVQSKRIKGDSCVPFEIRLEGMTFSAAAECFRRHQRARLGSGGSSSQSEEEESGESSAQIDEAVLAVHGQFSGFPLGIALFSQYYFLLKEFQLELKISSFWDQCRQQLDQAAPTPFAIVSVLWNTLKDYTEQIQSTDMFRCVIRGCELLCLLGHEKRISKILFDASLRSYCAIDGACDEWEVAAASDYVLRAKIMSSHGDFYLCHPLVQQAMLESMFHVKVWNGPTAESALHFDRILPSFCPSHTSARVSMIVQGCMRVLARAIDESLDLLCTPGCFVLVVSSPSASPGAPPTPRPFFSSAQFLHISAHLHMMESLINHFISNRSDLIEDNLVYDSFRQQATLALFLKMQLFLSQKHYKQVIILCAQLSEVDGEDCRQVEHMSFQVKFCHMLAIVGSLKHREAMSVLQELLLLSSSAPPDAKWNIRIQMVVAFISTILHDNRAALTAYETALSAARERTKTSHDDVLFRESYSPSHLLEQFLCVEVGKMMMFFEKNSEALILFREVQAATITSSLQVEAVLCEGLCASKQVDFVKALGKFEEGLQLATALFGVNSTHVCVARLHLEIGVIHTRNRQYAQALDAFERCLSVQRMSVCAAFSAEVGSTLRLIGNVLLAQGGQQKALDRYCEALEQFQDEESVELAATLDSMAKLYAAQGKFADSLTQYKIVLAMQMRVLPRSHRIIAHTLKDLGHTYESLRRYKEALGQYNATLVMERKCYNTEIHAEIAETHHCIGHIYSLERDYDNALMHYEKALVVKRLVYGNEHAEVVSTLNHMGNLHKYRGQYDVALALHSEVLALKKILCGEDSPSVQTTVEIIGKITRIDLIRQDAERLLTSYIEVRCHEVTLGEGMGFFSKDAKVSAAQFLLHLIKDKGVEQFNNLDRIVGYYKHKAATENGRLFQIVEKIRLEAFTNFS